MILLFPAFQFEVATVKPTPPETRIIGDLVSMPGGRVLATRCTLELLMQEAFDIDMHQITGGPRWIREDHFDVDARPPVESITGKRTGKRAPLNDEQKQMLQALLLDRFELKYHRETREGPVYFLDKGKKLKLEKPANDDPDARAWLGSPAGGAIMGDGIAGKNLSMPVMARRLSRYLKRPVASRNLPATDYFGNPE